MGTSFHVYGPMSTTAEFEVAVNFATHDANEGMVIDILNKKISAPLFNCQYWSDYTEENERLFIGSLQAFTFESIHHLSMGLNYEIFIRRICILMTMIIGYPYEISAIHDGDFQCLSDLISDHINNTHTDHIPLYINKLFTHIMQNVNKIHLDLFWFDEYMKWEKEAAKQNVFGYQLLKSLFFVNNQVNFGKLCQIFNGKLQQIVIFNYCDGTEFDQSIHLNSFFLDEILFGIQTINQTVALQSVLNEILIINPFESIHHFINENQVKFVMNGWKLNETSFQDKKRFGAKSDNVLSIKPL